MPSSYYSALSKAVDLAPDINKATEFIKWAEDICELITYIYSKDYDEVTEDLVKKVKESQEDE